MKLFQTIIFLFALFFSGCSKSNDQLIKELQNLNVTITDNGQGETIAMVAGGPVEGIYDNLTAFCKTEKIPCIASLGHGNFGLYVRIHDFYKIQSKLIKYKQDQKLGNLLIYGTKHSNKSASGNGGAPSP